MFSERQTRRSLLGSIGLAATAGLIGSKTSAQTAARAPKHPPILAPPAFSPAQIGPFATPYKFNKLVLSGTGDKKDFDWKEVDCPFLFTANDRIYMTYVGFDGVGYQTGLAQSHDMVSWERVKLIVPRNPNSTFAKYNMAMMCILRDPALASDAPLQKVNGRYLGAWHAYPNAGYEAGPAVIGLAWSDDLLTWEVDDPILTPGDAAWEHGGLYKPYLVREGDTYYLFYNAKTAQTPWIEQTGVATSKDLKTWTRFAGNPILTVGPKNSPDDRFASDPCVVRHGKLWAMYYYGLSSADGKARELLALGHDPFHFSKANAVLVDAGGPGSVDDDFAHKPSVITWKGDLYHFYCAVSGKWPNDVRGISVARSRPW